MQKYTRNGIQEINMLSGNDINGVKVSRIDLLIQNVFIYYSFIESCYKAFKTVFKLKHAHVDKGRVLRP